MDKAIIANNFSRSAHSYDRYADIQQHAGVKLLTCAEGMHPGSILEVGCGTGAYTLLLKEKFPGAQIKAIDIAPGMLAVARDKLKGTAVDLVRADAEEMHLQETFDLITGNACVQWFNSPGRALELFKRQLNPGGVLLFSVFGPETFRELRESLEDASLDAHLAADNFISKDKLCSILRDNFSQSEMLEEVREEEFSGLTQLLMKIKGTGVKGEGSKDFSRAVLAKLNASYMKIFGSIKVTYQIFFCWAKL